MQEKKRLGGKREGAGRPGAFKDHIDKIVRIEKEMAKAIEAKGMTCAEFFREAAERRLKEGW